MPRYIDQRRFEELDRSKLLMTDVARYCYTACRTEDKTERTIRGYEEKLGRFVRWLDGTVGDLSLERARDFVAELQATQKWRDDPRMPRTAATLAPQTVANHVRVIKAFASWLEREGYTRDNLLARIVLPKVPSKVIEVLSEEEIGRLLAAVNPKGDLALRNIAILVLFLDTGLRPSELLSVKLDDLHIEDQWLKVSSLSRTSSRVATG